MDLKTIKKHLRITLDYDDELLEMYIKWAEEEVKNTVSTSATRNETFFDENETYNRAVVLLVSHFYENRKEITDKPQYHMIYGAKSAIMKLKIEYRRFVGD
ncbi:head-tail connector protein [Macrococcus capreoli]|uniref:head-tail connector protein n=1 Tax=Macrococcus capreoli TaxID=2982690 RepID=UPI0021D57C6D|nr:head-tail connector protein [Macrococcus sp. TMW 2.2395]MCU7557259.1 head-tail connector protein [Macrococcus sp. TMW 2.2395]